MESISEVDVAKCNPCQLRNGGDKIVDVERDTKLFQSWKKEMDGNHLTT